MTKEYQGIPRTTPVSSWGKDLTHASELQFQCFNCSAFLKPYTLCWSHQIQDLPCFTCIHRDIKLLRRAAISTRCREAAWPRGHRVGLLTQQSHVWVLLWPLAGFVLGRPEFKSSDTLVNSQLVVSCQFGISRLLCPICIICFRIICVECL